MKKAILTMLCATLATGATWAQNHLEASPVMQQVRSIIMQQIENGSMPKFKADTDPLELRRITEAAQAGMNSDMPGFTAEPLQLGGIDAEYCHMAQMRDDAVLIYIHGGGFMCGNAQTSRGYALIYASETHLPVYTFSYRLIPEAPFPAAVTDCFEAYKAVLERHPGKPVFLLGESAGATLCITTTMMARDNGVQLPAAIFPYSPVIDMSGALNRKRATDEDFTIDADGVQLMTDLYVTPELRQNPYASPYYDDMHGMPPTFLAWDMNEHLAPDSEEIVKKLLTQGVECHFKAYPHCFHAFAPLGRSTPESSEILDQTIQFIEAHIK